MAISAQSIIRRVVDTLQDPTSIRWPVAELVRYLNDGQREIKLHRPDTVRKTGDIPLKAGSRQSLPGDADKLIEIWRNKASGKAIQMVDRRILDDQTPGWHALNGVIDVLHYTYDPRVPTEFFVYPPAQATSVLEGAYSVNPTPISESSLDGKLWDAVTGNVAIIDSLSNALQEYILARCFMKDSEYAGNAARAQAHYTMFANSLGIEVKGTIGVAPTTLRKVQTGAGVPSSGMA
jgi:hypothetical protein